MPVARAEVAGDRVTVRLERPWRRFAYALAAEPVAGVRRPFRFVRTADRTVARRPGLTIVFRYMEPYAAVRAFRRGELDEAPVPQGELRALEADSALAGALRVRQLLGVDAVVFSRRVPRAVRRAYWLTAPRAEYQGLIPERAAPAAYGLLPHAERPSPADVRAARRSIRSVPNVPVQIGVPRSEELREAAELPWAEWRQLRLPVTLGSALGGEARFVRLIAPYPHREGLFTALGEPPQSSLVGLDRRLRDEALVVPLAHVVEARLVNPRVKGWVLDALGVVDYSRVYLLEARR